MDPYTNDHNRLKPPSAPASPYSDRSGSTIVPSPTWSNGQHFSDHDKSLHGFLPHPESPANTETSPSISGSPYLGQSPRVSRWTYRGRKSRLDEDMLPLKPHSQDSPKFWRQLRKRVTQSLEPNHLTTSDRIIDCNTKKGIIRSRRHWLSIMLLIVAFLSTSMSGIWLFLAANRQSWEGLIGGNGSIASSTSNLLFPLIAKFIELTFVTVFVAFLGQCLSRKAHKPGMAGGVTLADMSLRTWVLQPGTMLTDFKSLQSGALSWLGAVTAIAVALAMLYTTASDQLGKLLFIPLLPLHPDPFKSLNLSTIDIILISTVAPKLMSGIPRPTPLKAPVLSSFANVEFIKKQCKTPMTIRGDNDPNITSWRQTCMSIEHAGQAYILENP